MKIRFKQDKKTILKILKTAGIKRKLKVIDKLNGVNERDSINILLKILEDKSWVMREKAAHKLANFGNRVVPRLLRLINRGFWYTRASTCVALGEIGNIKALDAVVMLILKDINPTVLKEASTTLIKLAKNQPLEVIDKLKEMELSTGDLEKILGILKAGDSELSTIITEETEHE
jgi:HEAT repeat protein